MVETTIRALARVTTEVIRVPGTKPRVTSSIPTLDCADYQGTAGIDGDTIKIGTIRPADGSYAIYDNVTTGLEAWVTSVNSEGGVKAGDGNTYKFELIKENDSYDPAKTPALAQKLVEQEGVFLLGGRHRHRTQPGNP